MLWFYKWHRKLIKHLFPIDSNLISSYKSISKVHLKKNISLSTSSGSRQDRVAVTISPAQLNTLLLGIDVPGIPRNACATIEIFGNLSRWLFHHCNGSAFKAILNLDLYLSTSSWNQKYSFLALTINTSPKRSSIVPFALFAGGMSDLSSTKLFQ